MFLTEHRGRDFLPIRLLDILLLSIRSLGLKVKVLEGVFFREPFEQIFFLIPSSSGNRSLVNGYPDIYGMILPRTFKGLHYCD